MKFKVHFQRRLSVIITIFACASSILMMVKRFGFPEEEVINSIWISAGFLVVIIFIAVIIAFVIRLISDKREKELAEEFSEGGES